MRSNPTIGDGPTAAWKWNQRKKKSGTHFQVTEFLEEKYNEFEETVQGPGAGAGVGCGVGLGFGLVGGAGYGRSPWNHLRLAFGFGVGCGVGVGFGYGYGRGVGFGSSLGSILESSGLKNKKKKGDSARRRMLIEI